MLHSITISITYSCYIIYSKFDDVDNRNIITIEVVFKYLYIIWQFKKKN